MTSRILPVYTPILPKRLLEVFIEKFTSRISPGDIKKPRTSSRLNIYKAYYQI